MAMYKYVRVVCRSNMRLVFFSKGYNKKISRCKRNKFIFIATYNNPDPKYGFFNFNSLFFLREFLYSFKY